MFASIFFGTYRARRDPIGSLPNTILFVESLLAKLPCVRRSLLKLKFRILTKRLEHDVYGAILISLLLCLLNGRIVDT